MYAELRYLAVLYVYWVTVPQLHHLFFNWYSLRCDQAWWIRAFGEHEAIFAESASLAFAARLGDAASVRAALARSSDRGSSAEVP